MVELEECDWTEGGGKVKEDQAGQEAGSLKGGVRELHSGTHGEEEEHKAESRGHAGKWRLVEHHRGLREGQAVLLAVGIVEK